MSGDWVKLSERGLQSLLGSPDPASGEMCLLLIALSRVSGFSSGFIVLQRPQHEELLHSCRNDT